MHVQHIDFLDLLDVQVQYVVPRWQRRYRWGPPPVSGRIAVAVIIHLGDEALKSSRV